MAVDIRINADTMRYVAKTTFIGAGIGALAGHAVSWLAPAARIATPGGMVFGALFSLSRIVDKLVLGIFGVIFSYFKKSNDYVRLAVMGIGFCGLYLTRGALAFGLMSLMLPGFTLYNGLALTAIVGAVDLISAFVLEHAWMVNV